jgi:penicillin G amidase
MTYSHPLGMFKPLERFFNRGPFPCGGDIDTVNMGASLPSDPERVITVPSFRQIVDLADLTRSLSIHGPGQSGHPASKHYDDFIKLWMKVAYHPMLFARKEIEENAEGMLSMNPA